MVQNATILVVSSHREDNLVDFFGLSGVCMCIRLKNIAIKGRCWLTIAMELLTKFLIELQQTACSQRVIYNVILMFKPNDHRVRNYFM